MRLSRAALWAPAALPVALATGLLAAKPEPRRLEYGLDRSNLSWETPETENRTLERIAALRAAWFRDELSPSAPPGFAPFVRELKAAKTRGLSFLAIVNPSPADYPDGYQRPNAGAAFAKRCGWDSGSPEISRIDLSRFAARLGAELAAVKAAGLTVDAFEIGNEYDWICFNGDVPDGHEANAAEFERLVSGYARYLETAAGAIRAAFPDARIVTFGIARISETFDKGHHIAAPERILKALRAWDGINYLDNSRYRVAGVGLHLYPRPGQDLRPLRDVLRATSDAAGGLPVWITEWGYRRTAFAAGQSPTRAGVIAAFYAWLADSPAPLGPNFYYAYSERADAGYGLVGPDGREGAEAQEILLHAGAP